MFYLFSYLFVQDLPVQGNPVQVNAVVVKQKSPESGEFGVVYSHRADAPRMRPNRGVSRGDRGGVRGWCRVGLNRFPLLNPVTLV